MFDLSQLALKDTTTLHLTHPGTGEKLYADPEQTKPLEVILRGQASKEYRAALKALQNRALARQHKKEKVKSDDLEDERLRLLVAATAGFNNLMLDGKPLDNEVAYRALYADGRYSWLRDQVDEATADYSRFLEQ